MAPRKGPLGQRGQASVMIGMMMLTFMLFFAFVVNTGMLVHAKINLQNAVDMAAYAGAAVQARQLNHISFLNYEMRRQYKKFLFRYYVMGNLAQDAFPRNGGSPGPMRWSPDNSADYTVPAVCVIFNAKDNYCKLVSLPKIEIPPQAPLDQINETLRGQLGAIEQIRKKNCEGIGSTNITLLTLWLYNTDPKFDRLPSVVTPETRDLINVIKGLASGLGLLPKEFILLQRIKTLEKYVNTPSQAKVTKDAATALVQSADPARMERTLAAFYSAYNTLGTHLWIEDSIRMDELMPSDINGLLRMVPITERFDTFAVELVGRNKQKIQVTNAAEDCEAILTPVTMPQPIPLGVYKDPKILTYYALKLEGRARLLFSPIGDLRLKAYAAAQPFGSRIGPPAETVQLARTEVTVPPRFLPGRSYPTANKIPNLPIEAQDGVARGRGWDNTRIVAAMYQQFKPPGAAAGVEPILDTAAINRGYQAAMAPNPWEGNRYNIMSDLGNDPFVRYFDSQQKAYIWAPIFPPGEGPAGLNEIKKAVDDYFQNLAGEKAGDDPTIGARLKDALTVGLTEYLNKLGQGQGEDEGMNIVKIQDPFTHISDGTTQPQIIGLDPSIMMKDPKQYKTSWVTENDSNFTEEGRVGYSVKFVAFETLLNKSLPANDRDNWTNKMNPPDSEALSDISSPFMKH